MDMIISGEQVITRLKEELKEALSSYNGTPHIGVVLNIEDKPSKSYIKSITKVARDNGFRLTLYEVDSNSSEDEIKEIIQVLAKDDDVDGIIVTKPYAVRMKKEIINFIPRWKDIDGQTDANIAALYKKEEGLFPATPLAVMEFFKEVNYQLKGKHVVLIGRSRTVGLPLFHMLLSEDATCSICHSKTENLKEFTCRADVVISAAGVPGLITEDMVENATFLIDVAINVVGGKIVGDMAINFEEKEYKEPGPIFITPVPGGVGPVTSYMLLLNTIKGMRKRGKLPR